MSQEVSSGFFIPVDKQSLFILIFEEILLNSYNIVTVFGSNREDNSCEVKFHYFGDNLGKFPYATKMAKDFLKRNQHILRNKKIDKERIKSSSTVPEIIVLDDETRQSQCYVPKTVVDLTETEPELIVLDETVNQLSQTISELNGSLVSIADVDLEIIDLSNGSLPSQRRSSRCQSEIEILKVNKPQQVNYTSLLQNLKNNDEKIKNSNVNLKKRKSNVINRSDDNLKKRKSNVINRSEDLTISINKSGLRSVKKNRKRTASKRNSSLSKSPKNKKKKLQDVSNFPSSLTPPAKPLTGNALKYYSKLTSAIQTIKKRESIVKRNKLLNKHTSVQKHQDTERRRSILKAQNHQEIESRRRILKSQNQQEIESRRRILKSQKQHFNHREQTPQQQRKAVNETNTFNPNPLDVDRDGLRPVVVDGSNIARSHGKGPFSVKGIEICVDYFTRRGNKIIKVFLPLHCEEHFTKTQLAELKTKCDIIFTPSQFVNGVRKTSYDDRFIVQYAVEFGGVIVSTDNYRDLMKENPRWRDTIHKRLLMFTWVDDFLMFPMDPLGKNGPTLDEFLRF